MLFERLLMYEEILKKWMVSKSSLVNNDYIKRLNRKIREIDFGPAVRSFLDRVASIQYTFSDDALTSGGACFFGAVTVSLLQLGSIRNMDELFTFASCYMLLDHFLDDDTVGLIEKHDLISTIENLIDGSLPDETQHPIIDAVISRYLRLVNNIPSCIPHLEKLFQAVIETMKSQYSPDLTREQYMKSAEWKGGLTVCAIQSILMLPVTEDEYELGAIIQLVDDMIDLDVDIAAGINTIVTYDLNNAGILDDLFKTVLVRIDELSNKYNFFKPILITGLIFAAHIHTQHFSTDIMSLIEPYIHFSPSSSRDAMISWFKKILYKYH